MNYKDELAEEMGYVICPLCVPDSYCNKKCEECKHSIKFYARIKGKR